MAEEMMSFPEVTAELGISEEELKRMVADNDIRAFHEGGELHFKREDVENLKKTLDNAPTVVLSDTESDSFLEEPSVELEEPSFKLEEPSLELEEPSLELEEPSLELEEPSLELEEPSLELEEPSLELEEPSLELEEPSLEFEESALDFSEEALASEETVLSVDGLLEDDTVSLDEQTVDSLDIGDDTVLDSGLLEEEDLSLGLDETEEEGLLDEEIRSSGPRRIRARAQERHPVMTGLVVIIAVLMIFPGAVLINLAGGDSGVFPDWITKNLTFLNDMIDSVIGLF